MDVSITGVGLRKGTPSEIIDLLNHKINAGLADAAIRTRLADLAAVPLPMKPSEFGARMIAETEKWAKVIRAANIKAD